MDAMSIQHLAAPTAEIYSRWEVVRLFHVAHVHTFEEDHVRWARLDGEADSDLDDGDSDRGPPAEPRRFTFDTAARLFVLNLIPATYRQFHRLSDSAVGGLDSRWRFVGASLIDSDTPAADLVDAAVAQMRDMFTNEEMPELRDRLARDASRVESVDGRPARVYPFTRDPVGPAPRRVVIDPRVRFGRPTIAGTGIPTAAVFERHQAGDSLAEIAADYGTAADGVEEALRYEALGLARFRPPFADE